MTQYCGIIITETDLYVSVVKRIQNKIKVLDRYICKRGQSLISDLAVIHSKNKHTPTLYSLAYTEIPHLIFNKTSSNTPLQDAWKQRDELTSARDNQHMYQFILPTIDNQEWLYMVGISQSNISELQCAEKQNHMEIEVVSYWPVPLLDLHKNHSKPTLLLIEENSIVTGYLCNGTVIVTTINWNRHTETPKEMIQRLLKESPITLHDTLEIQAYLSEKTYPLWKDLISQYGEVNKSTINDVLNHFTYRWDGDVHMDASVGLSYYLARTGVQAEE
ncbi:hypothetical protein [Veillonella rodentium]|uniref:Uncharacterized protein n=1 Tax=Veillonella rodentium TaxID=248315 RepID=A0A239YLW8_9FIRM|nr:hypothetical protein [Veillonella rodentium]SNV59443.1 Uncharacterised protein [Veillonella rodentium]